MPTYSYTCEVCGTSGRTYRAEGSTPPRFCSRACKSKGLAGRSLKPVRWPITPAIHEKIKKVYQTSSGNGEVRDLARALGYPRWKITRHAIRQGWIAKQHKEPNWSEREIRLLEANAHLSPEVIQRKLLKYGFKRTAVGIVLKRNRLRLPSNLEGYSARDLARCFGVDDHFITAAIKAGRLYARRRGTDRLPQQGGDMYYIMPRAIKEYVVNHLHEIDLRKVDKYWFVDLLVNE